MENYTMNLHIKALRNYHKSLFKGNYNFDSTAHHAPILILLSYWLYVRRVTLRVVMAAGRWCPRLHGEI